MDFSNIISAIQSNIGVSVDGIADINTWKALYKNIIGSDAGTDDIVTMVKAVQTTLGISVDGDPGNDTWAAIADSLQINIAPVPAASVAGLDNSPVDARSEGVINTLLPQVQPYARTLVHNAASKGITIKVINGLRTYAEQDALYAQGRTTHGGIVTNARGGYSNHNFGLAFDIGVFEGSNYIDESPAYKTAGQLGVTIGLTWGGNWTTITDEPHFELRPDWATNLTEGDMLAELRSRTANDQPIFV